MRRLVGSSLAMVLGLGLVALGGCDYEPPAATGTGGQGGGAGGAGGEGGEGGGTGGAGGQGGGGACIAGETQACYAGPAGTAGVGECKAGTRMCESGTFGECAGEVVPVLEDCKQNVDTDCDTLLGCKGLPLDVAKGASSMQDDLFYSVAVHRDGVAYMAGVQAATLTNGAATAGRVLLARRGPDGDVTDWSAKIALNLGNLAMATDVAVAPNGDVAVVGTFAGTLVVGSMSYASQAMSRDAFLVVLNANGDVRFVKTFGDTNYQAGHTVAYDAVGHLLVGGAFAGTVSFGGESLTAAGEGDGFVAAYDGDGKHLWDTRATGGGFQAVEQLAVTKEGAVYVGGRFEGESSFGNIVLAMAEMKDIFFGRLDPDNGAVEWSKQIGGPGDQALGGMAVSEKTGEIALSGTFSGTLDLGGQDYTNAEDTTDMFLAFYSNIAGQYLRSSAFQTIGNQVGTGVAFDPIGDLLVGCVFTESMKIGSQSFTTANGLDANACAFKVKGESLDVLWAHEYGDAWPQLMASVAVSPRDGHSLFVGGFWSVLEGANPEPASTGVYDPFVLELSP